MASELVGTWNLESSENWDEYLKALGVGFLLRKTAASVKPTLTITNDGDRWTFKLASTFKNTETNFQEGVEFDEDTLDGRKTKNVITRDGPNRLVHEQRDAKTNEVATTIIREIKGDKFVQTLTVKDVSAVRTFKRA